MEAINSANVSRALWDAEKGMAEIIVRSGKIWNTTGVTRFGLLLCHIEEVVFLMEQRNITVMSGEDIMTVQDAYSLLTVAEYGCSWDAYLVYAYLKRLGYILKRNGIPWTLSKKTVESMSRSSEGNSSADNQGAVNPDLTLRLMFDVYPPNGCFKKTCPRDPAFHVCVISDRPPHLREIQACEEGHEGVPVKFASVVCGHVTLFSINSVQLPELP
ncbi:hypothetical protein O6H91_01G095800 [Diphasiastrum complanatum]|uniref:Uncharacterized protein n=1 Tax=Diphasiastrum complanatum TaxID=34168 RepID=A0ACC2ETK0_DIPCM|nr:hypothetical protein O6H91_Y198300 [Diphasiastrum complanatum]KAJ7569814.1 hypothetical protein O6H91_01G095800 [Diphasiastrum complanatum]